MRRTRRTYEAMEMDALEEEMTELDAYVSPGRGYWRGLSGRDPLAELTDEEYGLQRFEDWHDASEVDEERPTRSRPRGRDVDIVPPVVGEVTVRVDPAIAAAHAARQRGATPTLSYESAGGHVTVEGALKIWRGACAQCGTSFEQRRPVSQRRRWASLCGDECRTQWDRERARDRMRRLRGDEAA
ncbi:hypothetical protein ACIQVL_49890 [Streptomyces sp. NPDC090499]|uniref:hypothetical protein n=1 Tax=Streptomyces sp. NPDC090499 TaxID=3365965 RepID=UPI0037FD7169